MKKSIRFILFCLAFISFSCWFIGCGHSGRSATSEAAGFEDDNIYAQKEPWDEKTAMENVYSSGFIMIDEVIPGKYPPPTEKVKSAAAKYLTKQAAAVKSFFEKNRVTMEAAAKAFCTMSEQSAERKYYYEIAEQKLITTFALPEDDFRDNGITQTLESVSKLRKSDMFERIYINTISMEKPCCEFSGALKLFDGIGCYVSLVYFPDGSPDREELVNYERIDDHWALLKLEQWRDELGGTLPKEKRQEVREANYAKQAWQIYHFWQDHPALFDRIRDGMIDFCEREPLGSFHYSVKWDDFGGYISIKDSYGQDKYEGPGPSEELLGDLHSLAVPSDDGLISNIYTWRATEDDIICRFEGQYLFVDGSCYYNSLVYTTGEVPDELSNVEVVYLGPHWYMRTEYPFPLI